MLRVHQERQPLVGGPTEQAVPALPPAVPTAEPELRAHRAETPSNTMGRGSNTGLSPPHPTAFP